MKVLIATDWYAPTINGVVTSVLNLQRELESQGHEVRVLTLSQSRHTLVRDKVTYVGAMSAGLIYPGARLRTALATRQVQALIRWRPDVIHTQCEFSTFLLARKISDRTGAPIVHTYHTVYEDYTHYFSPSRTWGRRMVALFSRHVIAQTACVIAPTEKVRGILEGYGVCRPVYVIPSGIDLNRFSGLSDEAYLHQLKAKLKIPENNFVLTYVGRLAKEKNVEELLPCLAELKRNDVTLLLVGDGPYRQTLEETVRDLGLSDRVVFAGMAKPTQVADYYRLGDLFVSASTSETQGLTYIEALASGLPALCRKDACLAGVIEDGVNGWQFHNGDEFIAHLQEYLADEQLRNSMRAAAADSARQNFSAEGFARRVAEVYASAMEGDGLWKTA
ncbi:1,2-diacylglycerol 3-glucosyltransferase [Oscillibacter valericigenes Sjm18-20]|nr:1,2-diacylglycerol 3-glucosyltransferase [Oscillibacter valericigenes Sjm18-20]